MNDDLEANLTGSVMRTVTKTAISAFKCDENGTLSAQCHGTIL